MREIEKKHEIEKIRKQQADERKKYEDHLKKVDERYYKVMKQKNDYLSYKQKADADFQRSAGY